ncbi:MAG: ABC transporter permease subunit [Clostridiales Family XIII bacterium]|jgi:NitT/TauT family transport system permease protein|nr:ABC transporter permease subunit [Clostridiales Family XIII bacterium]
MEKNYALKNAPLVKILGSGIPPIVLIVALLAFWQISCVVRDIPTWMLARPTAVGGALASGFGALLPDILSTYANIIIGFALAVAIGLAVAILISSFSLLSSALTPLIIALCCIPMVTLVPMMMLVLGTGPNVKIIAIIIQAFPLVNLNSVVAFLNVSPERLELMQSLKANRVQSFLYCVFPDGIHGVFTGIRLASIMAMVTGVSSEIIGGNAGLGSRIIYFINFSKTADAFSCIIYIAVLGIIIYGVISIIESRVKW